MLRRIPFTPLVCLILFFLTISPNAVPAAGIDDSLDVRIAPNQPSVIAAPVFPQGKPRLAAKGIAFRGAYDCLPPNAQGIFKVKPGKLVAGTQAIQPGAFALQPFDPQSSLYLPAPNMRQWEMSFQVFFANMNGYIGWPRFSNWGWWGAWGGSENRTDLNGDLQLPIYAAWPQFTARYNFRPNWAVRYSVLWNQLNGGGMPNNFIQFGPSWGSGFFWGQTIQSKLEHAYHRVGLVYDALRTCNSKVGVYADWVHTDTKITLGCNNCGWNNTRSWSNSINAAIAGLEIQRAFKMARNGAVLSWDCKAGGVFLDDTVGGDLETAARYSIPLNCGRSGYIKGGYRMVELRKTQYDFIFKNTLSGGFIEGGFIF